MSTASIILIIVCVLVALVCFAFVNQTISTRREQRARLSAALRNRARNFKFILQGVPDGFISKELSTLVQRSLVDVLEQLSRLEPKEPQHLQDLQILRGQMTEMQRRGPAPAKPTLENPQQIKEVRACLEELYKFVHKLEERQSIPRNLGKVYRQQIKDLVLQVSVDNYCLNAAMARQSGKTKLALHYYELAHNLIVREQKSEAFKHRMDQFRLIMDELKQKLAEENQQTVLSDDEEAERDQTEKEWVRFSDAGSDWRKKNVYD